MKKRLSLHLFLVVLLIFSLFPVVPSRVSAAIETLIPIQSRNSLDGDVDVAEYAYIYALENYVTVIKFDGIHPSRQIESAYLTINGYEELFDLADLVISVAEDGWPTTAPGHQYPDPHPMPALLSPEQSIHLMNPNLFKQGPGDDSDSFLYRFDVKNLMTPSREDGIISFLFSSTSMEYDLYFNKYRLEIEYVPNTAPVLNPIGNRSVNEGSQLSFNASATDAEGNPLTYSLVGAPTGASINASSGAFTWIPTEEQGPGEYTFTVSVSDGELTDEESITVSVAEVNTAPVLNPIGNRSIDEESLLTFIASATDADIPANTLTYSLVGAPTGATINASSGEFSWTPTEAQGPGSYPFTVRVSDGVLNDEETITITVNEVNAPPILAPIGEHVVNEGSLLTFIATATDSDSATLTYSLIGEPAGALIHPSTGVFTWTPTEMQGPGLYTFKVVVSDGTASDEEEISITVDEVNAAPILDPIGDQEVNEGSLLTITATASDDDYPANTMSYSLVGAPTGASINASSGIFTWTPTEEQGPGSFTFKVVVTDDGSASDEEEITVTVHEVNTAPVLDAITDKTVEEETELTFIAIATDSDLPANTLTFSLIGPVGATIDEVTGEFSWIPTEAQGPGTYLVKILVSDGELTDEQDFNVTVNEVNAAPVLDAIGDHVVNEESLLTFTATANDPDSLTLSFSLVNAPTGASINEQTGEFSWTPTEAQGPDSYTFKVIVSDGSLSDEEEITVTVNEVNIAPVLAVIDNKTVNEGSLLNFTVTATDADLPANSLSFSLVDAPTGATINASTGEFSWTPTEAQGSYNHTFTVVVSDGTLTDEQEITVTVHEINVAPVLAAIGNKMVNEGSELSFTVTATDIDLPANTLSFSLVNAPTGATIDAITGEFSWTPSESQGPDDHTFTIVVSDGALTDEEEITVTVNEVNSAPVLAAIGNKNVNEGSPLSFIVIATDSDLPANTLTFSIIDAPAGASIDPETGEFSWTPTELQGPNSYTLTIAVSDGMLSDEEEITITVQEVNTAPVLAAIGNHIVNEGNLLNFTVTATDADLPANTLSFSLVDAPIGATIHASSGEFSWTPTEAQGPGSYTFTVVVSDGALSDEEEITVTVHEVNTAPVLAAIGNKTVNEGSLLSFTAVATDADQPANPLSYSLVGAPTGATINATTGEFNWTPTEAQGPNSYTFSVVVSDGVLSDEEEITVTVHEVNAAPVLAVIGDKTVNEGSLLTFTATATDQDIPVNTLSFSLVNAPTGATISASSGEFSWTPTEAQGPGDYTFSVVVSDGELSDEEEITVTVNEVNIAPVLAAIGDKTVNEGDELSFTATATDADQPANPLSYSLVNAPTGAKINATTGEFSWTPSEEQGPNTYTFSVVVSDGALSDEEEITVTVNEINTAPVLAAVGDKTVNEGNELSFTASATDADLPANTLGFSLDGAPAGATIDASNGEFSWTPTEAQGPGEYTFTIVVSDGALSDEEEITVTVNEVNTAPVLASIGDKSVNEGVELSFTAVATDADLPANTLSYSLVDAPTGATIEASSGVFSWTPSEAQGPGEFTFTVVVSDGALTDEEEITVAVNEVNTAPVIAAIGNQSIDEETELSFVVSVTDTDLPSNSLTFSLLDAPEGASINATTGEFSWIPTEAQGPNSYTFKVHVSDGELTHEEEITVTVNEVNTAPVLAAIGNKSVTIGNLLKFSVSATDIDLPANTLVYSLVDGPAGAVIDSETGEFSWRPGTTTGKITFTIQVSDGGLTDEQEITVTVISVSIPVPQPDEEEVAVLVNGKVENAGKITTVERNGQKVVTLVVNEQLITKRLEEEGRHAVITIPVNIDGNVVIGELSGQLLKMMQNLQSTIVLKTKNASYTLPIEQIDLAAISKKFGDNVAVEDMKISIEISESTSRGAQLVTEALKRIGVTQLVPPLHFKVNVDYKGQSMEVSQFNAYVKRSIAIPASIDPKRITTGVVVENDGTVRHVPTQVIESENSSEAIINSLTNSTYTLIWNPIQFTDVENHWAKDAINNMGSRLIASGVGNGMYNPDQDITRAEFAAIIVRGLGLRLMDGESAFKDVSSSSWYHQAVQTAHHFGLISGFEDGTFRPNEKITREQAMLILSKAMVMTGLLEGEGSNAAASMESLRSFVDADSISTWALNGVAQSVNAGIFSGRSKDTLAPKSFITRAEVATIVQRLLQKSNLID